jgi:hypothetical protein
MDSMGDLYEKAADTMLSSIAALDRVERQRDFGIDFYCQPRRRLSPQVETVDGLAAIQVKGNTSKLSFGGFDADGEWRKYEFFWLASLSTPLYLAQVSVDLKTCSLFSLAPLWLQLMRRAPLIPFEVIFSLRPPASESDWEIAEPTYEVAAERGDGCRWKIDLGAPVLHLAMDNMTDKARNEELAAVLQARIVRDRENVARYQQGIGYFNGLRSWITNSAAGAKPWVGQAWQRLPGAKVDHLCEVVEPILVNLGLHLEAQKDPGAIEIIPALEWLHSRQRLGTIGRGLLRNLTSEFKTDTRSKSAAEPLGQKK